MKEMAEVTARERVLAKESGGKEGSVQEMAEARISESVPEMEEVLASERLIDRINRQGKGST